MRYPQTDSHFNTMDQCQGRIKDGSRRCRISVMPTLKKPLTFCHWHYPCQGFKRDGTRCRAFARRENSVFCMDDHDPSKLRPTDTSIFRIDNLCYDIKDLVLKSRDYQDPYQQLDIKGTKGLELDHVVEIQMMRDSFDDTVQKWHPSKTKKSDLTSCVKSSINISDNLAFTKKGINNLKFQAVRSFLLDYKDKETDDKGTGPGLHDYLLKGTSSGRRQLTRKVTRQISREMVNAFEKIQDSLPVEKPIVADLEYKLHTIIFEGMKLEKST